MIPYFCQQLGKMSQNLSSAAIVIGALRVKNGVMENGLIWNRIEYVGKISPLRGSTFAKIAAIFLPLLNGYAVFSLGSGYFPLPYKNSIKSTTTSDPRRHMGK